MKIEACDAAMGQKVSDHTYVPDSVAGESSSDEENGAEGDPKTPASLSHEQ